MPSWDKVQGEIKAAGSVHDVVRRQHLKRLEELTGRNTIVYYSGWNEKQFLISQGLTGAEVNDSDKNGFMSTIHELDRGRGLDLLLHTPGGNVAATESLVHYLRAMFGTNIRVIVPQLAMSAGTMIALSAKSIVMGKHSSLGPIDPQIAGMPAHGLVEEFNNAVKAIREDVATIPIWQPILAKYPPTLIGEAQKAIVWADAMVREWLITGMFEGENDAAEKAAIILAELGSHELTLSHDRHIHADKAIELGIKVEMLEKEGNDELQEAVLSVHHACIQTLAETPAFKIIENHMGVGFITSVRMAPTNQ